MGNVGSAELLVILLVGLLVLGPTKLPAAVRQVGRVVGEIRRISSGFRQEMREVVEEPIRETKATLAAADPRKPTPRPVSGSKPPASGNATTQQKASGTAERPAVGSYGEKAEAQSASPPSHAASPATAADSQAAATRQSPPPTDTKTPASDAPQPAEQSDVGNADVENADVGNADPDAGNAESDGGDGERSNQ